MLSNTILKQDISTHSALQLCHAAMKHAEQLQIAICITIVCSSGRPLTSISMNQAPLLSLGISHKKAITAVSFNKGTHEWQTRLAEKNNILMALQSEEQFTFLGGGLPITIENAVIGAIGISGGSEQQDIDCATAAIDTLTSESK